MRQELCEFCIVLWSSVEISGCNSQKMSRPTGKRVTASSWQCKTPYNPNNPGENSTGTSWTSSLQPGLDPQWLIRLVRQKTTLLANVSLMRRWSNGGAKVAETTIRRLLCCGSRRTGKAMWQVYQCWMRIWRETNVFPRFESQLFYVLLPFVTYLLNLSSIMHK
jgi:hypothetical protein